MTEKKNKDFMCSMDLRVKPEDDRGGESGRSMVEMLGVLAVVGVLSVGGIAGYTYAMNKHYANELLNGASQRAVILKSQKAAGLPLSLREFDGVEVAGGTFESVEELEDGSAFIIPVSGVKGAVCENLIKATDGTDITIAKDDDETLTDITEEDCDDENDNNILFMFKTGIGSAETSGSNKDVGVCENGNVYLSYNVGAECETETPDNMGCTKNSDCADGEFCNITSSAWSCYKPDTGTCTAIGKSKSITTEQSKKLTDAGFSKTIEISEEYMSWWAAENWCKAKNKNLIDIGGNRLQCHNNNIEFDIKTTGYCCCDNTQTECSRGTTCNNTPTNQSVQIQALRAAFPSTFPWTKTSYDSCEVLIISLGGGSVDRSTRAYSWNNAGCE